MEPSSIPVIRFSEDLGFLRYAKPENVLETLQKVTFHAATRRDVEGGDGGDFVKRNVQLTESNFSESAAGIKFNGSLKAHIDGEVAYIPSEQSEFLVIAKLPESFEESGKVVAVKTPSTSEAIVLGAGVYHSLPISLNDKLVTFMPVLRETEVVHNIPFEALVNPKEANETSFTKALPKAEFNFEKPKLQDSFASERLSIQKPTPENFAPYGELHAKVLDYTIVPCANFNGHSRANEKYLSQDFRMEWIEGDVAETKKIQFSGLTGSFAGGQGCPGVVRDPKGIISADLLMTRPDGGFCIEPIEESDEFVMFVAAPREDNKEPIAESLKAFVFKGVTPILRPEVWHSVPIPTGERIVFRETISITNANVVINVPAESGNTLSATF